jgi:Putative Actinobacterial Holin-X, holin superfamily III
MAMPGVEQVGQRPLEELVQSASQQAVVLAREQVDVARDELTARARQAGPGVAMVGGGALLTALASGTGTAALVLLLARRSGPSAAALGVTGAYAGAGAFLVRKGLVRLREAAPPLPDVPVEDEPDQNASNEPDQNASNEPDQNASSEPVQNAKQDLGPAKRRTKSAAKSPRRTKSAAKSPPQPTDRPKPESKSPSSRRGATRPQTDRARRQAS